MRAQPAFRAAFPGGVGSCLSHRLPAGHGEHQQGKKGQGTTEIKVQPAVRGVDGGIEVNESGGQPGNAHHQQGDGGDFGQSGAHAGAPILNVEDGTGQHKLYDHIGQGDAVSADRIQKTSPAQCGKEFVQQGDRGQIHPAKDDRVHQNAGPTDHEAAPAPESGGGVDHLASCQGQHGDGLHIGKGEGQLYDDTQRKGHDQIEGAAGGFQPSAREQQPGGPQHTADPHSDQAEKADGLFLGEMGHGIHILCTEKTAAAVSCPFSIS